jgi:hypothetical protein
MLSYKRLSEYIEHVPHKKLCSSRLVGLPVPGRYGPGRRSFARIKVVSVNNVFAIEPRVS